RVCLEHSSFFCWQWPQVARLFPVVALSITITAARSCSLANVPRTISSRPDLSRLRRMAPRGFWQSRQVRYLRQRLVVTLLALTPMAPRGCGSFLLQARRARLALSGCGAREHDDEAA